MLSFAGDSCFLKTEWSWNQVCSIKSSLPSSLGLAIALEISGTKGGSLGKAYKSVEQEIPTKKNVINKITIFFDNYF